MNIRLPFSGFCLLGKIAVALPETGAERQQIPVAGDQALRFASEGGIAWGLHSRSPLFSSIVVSFHFSLFRMELRKLQKTVVAALEDIKGKDITVMDTRKLTSLFDAIIIACGDSNRQVKALARNVQDKAREAGHEVISVEGEESGEWVLVDLGDIVVHVMQPAIRAYYNLEELWQSAPDRAHHARMQD